VRQGEAWLRKLRVNSERQARDRSLFSPGVAPALFDCFLFHDELDLLELRLGELWDSVDRFVLVESTLTFSGTPKPLYFSENRNRFAPFASKLTTLVFDEPVHNLTAWQRRERQCNALLGGLGSARTDDIVLLSDIDEIVSPRAIVELRRAPPATGDVVCFELRMFNFYLNLEIDELWLRSGPRAAGSPVFGRWSDSAKSTDPSKRRYATWCVA
jgi:beta-1,4-mannosyl-glycoprotein beta-1,4-N-acetylglucosaminyltransferase